MRAVVEQERLLGACGRPELATNEGVARRDRECRLGGAERCARDADPPLDECAEHREEPFVRILDRTGVPTVWADLGEPVQEGLARDAHVVEADPSVVDAVEPELLAAVLDVDAVCQTAAVVSDWDDKGMHAMRFASDLELGEDDRHPPVHRGVADVVLARTIVRGVDDELLGLGVIRRRRSDRLHVRSVPRLGHGEAAW